MSDSFRGITFAEQTVTPADDAIVRRAILPDGVLTGCEISYSGSTLTMAAGFIIACGRTFQHTTAQNWAVVDATSGFARLVLTIDLTKTSTEDTFSQIDSAIEYASSEDGFVGLEQDDINLSGTRYQIVAAVVSLGTGGITSIVSQLEKSRVEGGGGLNFSVVGGVTQPNDPKENTIWVNTEHKITSWAFSATEPAEPVAGMVWISTGDSSGVAFNALKKNAIQVYPLSAKQYVDGAWVDVTAYSYQGGEWVGWITYLYNLGDECEDITGGWTYKKGFGSCSVTKNSDNIYVACTEGSSGAAVSVYPTNKIDLTSKSKLKLNFSSTRLHITDTALRVITEPYNGTVIAKTVLGITGTDITVELDVSNVSGEYYVEIYATSYSGDTNLTIHELSLR